MSVPLHDDEPAWLRPAIDAVAAWVGAGTAPRDALAAAGLTGLVPADRALTAQIAYAAVRDERRNAWLLGPGMEELGRNARAAALVLAAATAHGELGPRAAVERFAGWSAAELLFERVADADEEFAAVEDEAARQALRWSLPDWAMAALRTEFGSAAEAVAASLSSQPPRAIRANLLKVASRGELAARLADEGVSTSLSALAPDGLVVHDDVPLFATQAYRDGLFEQQDEGSQLVAMVTAPPPKGRVFDACAGSGGKSLALCAMLANRGRVLAADVHKGRLAALQQRAARAGAFNLDVAHTGEDSWPEPVQAFARGADRILLDVPCSGLGSWRRRPEARWALAPQDLASMQRTQQSLLDRAAALLKPGARLVYATCTILRAENEAQIEGALQRHPELEEVRIAEILGGKRAAPIADASGMRLSVRADTHGCDGFFVAVLRRRR